MVNLLNGQIQVSSIPNEVTTFDVWLPVMEVTVDNEDEKVAEELVLSSDEQAVELKNSSVEFDKNKQTIMIIDDDPSMLWFVTEIFVGAYNVVSLGSAEEAFEAVGHPVTGFDYFGCNDARYGWNVVCQKDKSRINC